MKTIIQLKTAKKYKNVDIQIDDNTEYIGYLDNVKLNTDIIIPTILYVTLFKLMMNKGVMLTMGRCYILSSLNDVFVMYGELNNMYIGKIKDIYNKDNSLLEIDRNRDLSNLKLTCPQSSVNAKYLENIKDIILSEKLNRNATSTYFKMYDGEHTITLNNFAKYQYVNFINDVKERFKDNHHPNTKLFIEALQKAIRTGIFDIIEKPVNNIDETYTLVQFPESQEYMEEKWFDEEAILDVNGKFGDSAYFIPTKYI